MKIAAIILATVACAACSNGGTTGTTGGTGTAQVAVVNALPAGVAAQLQLDQSTLTLPSSGQTATFAVDAGAHQLVLRSASGHQFGTLAFSVDADSTRTVVLTGTTDSAAVSIPADSIRQQPPIDTIGHGTPTPFASTMIIDNAPTAGQLDLIVKLAGNTDSVFRFGNFTSQPHPFRVPWQGGTYTFAVTHLGDTTPLASVVFTMQPNENWNVILATSVEGGLVLQAVKQ